MVFYCLYMIKKVVSICKYSGWLCTVWVSLCFSSCYKEKRVEVVPDFTIEIVDGDHSVPVVVRIRNRTIGADLYEWTFEGGNPEKSNKSNPDDINYRLPGSYTIRLEAWNTTERKVKELTLDVDSALSVVFSYQIAINRFSPVEVTFINYSRGGNRYYWEFERGEPSVSEKQAPPPVTFSEPGKHVVRLQMFNTHKMVEYTDTIHVLPALAVDFDYVPDPDHTDMQAPFIAGLFAHGVSVSSYQWEVEGGVVENDTLPHTKVFFDKPGKYEIVLKATNQKEVKSVIREITVLEKSNLYTVENLSLGITTALNTVGCFYSSASRSILRADELTAENGPGIDLVFWGLGEDLRQACFISPDSAALKAFPDIPGARHSWFINCPGSFGVSQFDAMSHDELLKTTLIRENGDQSVNIYFKEEMLPHVVLFETEDGRKGAVKVKELVRAGRQSYVIADIKIQKDKPID